MSATVQAADQGGNGEALEALQCDKGFLYEKGRHIIWVIEMKGEHIELNEDIVVHLTGFSLDCNGSLVIITRARDFYFINATSVKVRRFNGTFKIAKVKFINHQLDLVMLEVVDDDDQVTNEYGELVLDGSLSPCQELVYIGNPGNYVGSSFVGRACFPCEDLPFDINNYVACGQYKTRKMGCPIKRMVLGDLIKDNNREIFRQYDKKLNAYVPIIQCDGFPWMRGFPGSPIFNLDGKIVGMLYNNLGGYFVAIHVAAIRAFLNSNPPNEGTSKGTSKRTKISS